MAKLVNVHYAQRQVYFAQRDGLIKIGSSANPRQRCRNLGADLLVVSPPCRPGTYRLELAIHRTFDYLRVRGEWFRPDVYLLQLMVDFVGNEPLERRAVV